jgi:hypothetical protein
LELAGKFISALFPEQETFASTAVREGLPHIDEELPRARQARSLSSVSEAEIALYGAEVVVVFPIVSKTLPYLVAIFPKAKQEPIVQLVNPHIELFAQEFLRSGSCLEVSTFGGRT